MQEKEFTRDDLFLFAGFCMARKMFNPSEDVTIIFEDWVRKYKQTEQKEN
jgi:hypothetical protein